MIDFRCWHCHRRYTVPEARIGETITCSCKNLLRVPTKSGGKCRVKSVADWIMEIVLYGGGGALLGFGLAILIVSRIRPLVVGSWTLIAASTIFGFLLGVLGGERGLDWIGRRIKEREKP